MFRPRNTTYLNKMTSRLRSLLQRHLFDMSFNIIVNVKMTYIIYIIILSSLNISKIFSIWPPSYKVNLSQEETFVIFDPIERSELQDIYDEEEMINREDMKELKVESQKDKYYRIHHSLGSNNILNVKEEPVNKNKVFEEFNPNREYSDPFIAGFVNEDDQFMKDDDVIYFDNKNEVYSSNGSQKKKRNEKENSSVENYDYNNLKNQFNRELEQAIVSNETLNYTNVKEDETFKDSIKTLLRVKEVKNCTEEERKGIGFAAAECLWIDLNKPKLKNKVLERILRIVIIWIIIYLIIAIPLWCQYGWCFCCFRCKFCQPRKQIDEAKNFFALNPPGTYHDPDENIIRYQPTRYEKYAQKALEDELRKL